MTLAMKLLQVNGQNELCRGPPWLGLPRWSRNACRGPKLPCKRSRLRKSLEQFSQQADALRSKIVATKEGGAIYR